MRIAIDSNVFTMQKYGGVSRYLVRLGEEFSKMGNDVEVFGCFHTNRHLADSGADLTRMHYIEKFPRYSRRIGHYFNDLYSNLQLKKWQPDIIHESFCHSRMVGPRKPARVCTIHDMIHELYPQYWGKVDRTPEYRNKTLERCDAVICVSESTKRDLLKLTNAEPGKVTVIHHGFENITGNEILSTKEQLLINDLVCMPYLLYVGARHGYKNFIGFLRAVAESDLGNELNIVAFGGGPLTPVEIQTTRQFGMNAGQVLQGGGSDALLRALFRKAVAFVYPSLYEGFGFPPLEAMAQGCPVISSNASSMPEVIGDAAEFFDPTNINEMSGAIQAVAGSDARRRILISRGYSRMKMFSWEKCAEETYALYQKLL